MNIQTRRQQSGAIVTIEYSLMMLLGALSVLVLGIWLAGHFVDIVNGLAATLVDTAEDVYDDYMINACISAQASTLGTVANGAPVEAIAADEFVIAVDLTPNNTCNATTGFSGSFDAVFGPN